MGLFGPTLTFDKVYVKSVKQAELDPLMINDLVAILTELRVKLNILKAKIKDQKLLYRYPEKAKQQGIRRLSKAELKSIDRRIKIIRKNFDKIADEIRYKSSLTLDRRFP